MHQPGYIQEGQEAIFGYLLQGVYYRNPPGATTILEMEADGTVQNAVRVPYSILIVPYRMLYGYRTATDYVVRSCLLSCPGPASCQPELQF